MTEPLLAARDVRVTFQSHNGSLTAVRGVDLDVHAGETLALVGESGSGKSAFAKTALRLHQPPFTTRRTQIEGSMLLNGRDGPTELVGLNAAAMRRVRARSVGMIFQEALSALNPVMRVGHQVAEAVRLARPDVSPYDALAEAVDLLAEVGLPDPQVRARAYPHQLSGGQCQRIMIAIAAVRRPELLIADEPTTALDVTVQARILQLLRRIQSEAGMALLFITHDLGIVERIADRVAVMYAGQIVEVGPKRRIFDDPQHPYTRGLLASQPGRRRRGEGLSGQSPHPQHLPDGCSFRPRCRLATGACCTRPELRPVGRSLARCWRTVEATAA